MPRSATKCTVMLQQSTLCLMEYAITIGTQPQPMHKQLELFSENKPSTLPKDKEIIVAAIQAGTTIGVSDGSYKDNRGTPAGERLTASMCAPGQPNCHYAYRRKLAGLLSILYMVEMLVAQFRIQACTIEVGCDGKSALQRAFQDIGYVTPSGKHFDILLAIHSKLHQSPINWRYRHMYGNQDKKIE